MEKAKRRLKERGVTDCKAPMGKRREDHAKKVKEKMLK